MIFPRQMYDSRITDDEEPPKVPITLFGYATEPFLAARAVRSWRQTQLAANWRHDRKIDASGTVAANGRRRDRSDARNRRQALANFAVAKPVEALLLEVPDLLGQRMELSHDA
jgi:hypothetical protein